MKRVAVLMPKGWHEPVVKMLNELDGEQWELAEVVEPTDDLVQAGYIALLYNDGKFDDVDAVVFPSLYEDRISTAGLIISQLVQENKRIIVVDNGIERGHLIQPSDELARLVHAIREPSFYAIAKDGPSSLFASKRIEELYSVVNIDLQVQGGFFAFRLREYGCKPLLMKADE